MQGLNPILGVIFDFNNSDLYSAHKGSKAYLNDREISGFFFKSKKKNLL
jgi:fructose-1,6-bisphosphatase/inositol monophosphatase family enzyme